MNGHGQHWPPGWVRGQGFVKAVHDSREMFDPFAQNYIDQKPVRETDATPSARSDEAHDSPHEDRGHKARTAWTV